MICPIPDGLKQTIKKPEAFSILKDVIENEKPFAFTRFGDGEAIILQTLIGRPPGENDIDQNMKNLIPFFKKVNRRWKTTSEPLLSMAKMSVPILEGLVESDMLGIAYKTGIPAYLVSGNSVPRCHWLILNYRLQNTSNLDILFCGKNVRVFSMYGEDLQKAMQKRSSGKISVTTIPLLTSLEDAQKFIENVEGFEEPLVLWGCGAGLKNLGVVLRNRFGKTCLDIGSVLDAWVGKRSRTQYREGKLWETLVIEQEDKK